MSKELIARLRDIAGKVDLYDWHSKIELEAADVLEAQAREIERLEGAAKYAEHIDATPENQRETMLHDALTERDTQAAQPKQDVKLIEYEEAHRTAWEAAAAFRPPYWGENFRAHSWVVEAVRSAHLDGQNFARGLPRIDRSAATGIRYEDHHPKVQAAQPVVAVHSRWCEKCGEGTMPGLCRAKVQPADCAFAASAPQKGAE